MLMSKHGMLNLVHVHVSMIHQIYFWLKAWSGDSVDSLYQIWALVSSEAVFGINAKK